MSRNKNPVLIVSLLSFCVFPSDFSFVLCLSFHGQEKKITFNHLTV